jgi:hypothetical protein
MRFLKRNWYKFVISFAVTLILTTFFFKNLVIAYKCYAFSPSYLCCPDTFAIPYVCELFAALKIYISLIPILVIFRHLPCPRSARRYRGQTLCANTLCVENGYAIAGSEPDGGLDDKRNGRENQCADA